MREQTLESRFWAKVDKSGDCWLWTGTKSKGYGYIHLNGRMVQAYRVSYQMEHGPIPEGMWVDHICHTPLCVRPDHLRAATSKENAENREGTRTGSKSGIRGVSWYTRGQKWKVQVGHAGKNHYFGYFESLEEAEAIAIEARRRLFTHSDMDA